MLENRGKLLKKVKTIGFIFWNLYVFLLLISSILIIPLSINIILKPHFVLLKTIGFSVISIIFLVMLTASVISGFQRKFFEIYEEGFISIRIYIWEIFNYKKKFIFFKTIRKVEIKEINNIKLINIYTNYEKYIEIHSKEIDKDTIENLVKYIKNYAEKNNIKIEWSDRLTPIFQRKKLCKKLRNHEIKYNLGVDSHAKNKYT